MRALIASSVPPILWSLFQFIKSRRIDALSLLIITGIALSILALLGGGGARFLQLRENLVTGVIGVVLPRLGGDRKAADLLSRGAPRCGATRPTRRPNYRAMRDNAFFERTMMLMTLVWGLGLIARTAIAVVLVFSVSIPTYLALNAVVGYASTFLLIGLTVLVRPASAPDRGMARRAAAQARALEPRHRLEPDSAASASSSGAAAASRSRWRSMAAALRARAWIDCGASSGDSATSADQRAGHGQQPRRGGDQPRLLLRSCAGRGRTRRPARASRPSRPGVGHHHREGAGIGVMGAVLRRLPLVARAHQPPGRRRLVGVRPRPRSRSSASSSWARKSRPRPTS